MGSDELPGCTDEHRAILRVLQEAAKEELPLCKADLSRELGCARATLEGRLQLLLGMGLVILKEKKPQVFVFLTDQGRQIVADGLPV